MVSSAIYHDLTCYDRYKLKGHHLDWENQPEQFKNYPSGSGTVELMSSRFDETHKMTLWEFATEQAQFHEDITLSHPLLSRVLYLTCGLTAKTRSAGNTRYFRVVPYAGALYPTEIYLAVFNSPELKKGLYHCKINPPQLIPLRHEDIEDIFPRLIPTMENKKIILLPPVRPKRLQPYFMRQSCTRLIPSNYTQSAQKLQIF